MALGRAYVSRLLRTCVQFWASGQGASMSSAIQSARMEFNSSGVMADPGLCSCPGLRTVMQRFCRVQRVGASASCAWAAASCTSCAVGGGLKVVAALWRRSSQWRRLLFLIQL